MQDIFVKSMVLTSLILLLISILNYFAANSIDRNQIIKKEDFYHPAEQKGRHHIRTIQFSLNKPITLLAIKNDKIVELWSGEEFVKTYKFTGYSGTLGPKLKEGDRQIPEGLYLIDYLNPKSKFHLSFKINYPNDFDKEKAKQDKRLNLGGNIFFHGGNQTIGCIPIGNENIEELFGIIKKLGKDKVNVIISPFDFRKTHNIEYEGKPKWLKELYDTIKSKMQRFSKPTIKTKP